MLYEFNKIWLQRIYAWLIDTKTICAHRLYSRQISSSLTRGPINCNRCYKFWCFIVVLLLYPFGFSIRINKIIRCKYLTFYFYCASFENEIIKCFYHFFFFVFCCSLSLAFTHLNGTHPYFMMHLKTLFRAFRLCARGYFSDNFDPCQLTNPIILTGKAIFQFNICFGFRYFFLFFDSFCVFLPQFTKFHGAFCQLQLLHVCRAQQQQQHRLTERSINHKSI